MNVPLVIFGFFKLGFRFTMTTLLYIVFSAAFDWILRFIPVINPTEWHMIINYQLISKLPNEWNSAIWLFVFAVIGGVVLGASYALIYKIGSSSGGSDFITMYFSTTKNKNIGSINRNVNFVILTGVVIVNTFLMKTNDINETIKLDVLNNLNDSQWNNMIDAIHHWAQDGNHSLNVPRDVIDFAKAYHGGASDGMKIAHFLASDPMFDGYSHGMKILMKFKFILGPSWFASVIMIIIQAMVITAIYPKYKFRTVLITTTKAEEVKKFLFSSGYRNEVFEWESKMQTQHTMSNKTTLVITITVINWKTLEKGIYALDPEMNANVLRTRGVKGRENIELKTGKKDEYILKKLHNDKEWLKKIEDEALLKTIKEKNKQDGKKNIPSEKKVI
nr:YitT family protein [Williamsoniiplasma lucivorax]